MTNKRNVFNPMKRSGKNNSKFIHSPLTKEWSRTRERDCADMVIVFLVVWSNDENMLHDFFVNKKLIIRCEKEPKATQSLFFPRRRLSRAQKLKSQILIDHFEWPRSGRNHDDVNAMTVCSCLFFSLCWWLKLQEDLPDLIIHVSFAQKK